jgi:hypothetical protein
MKSLELMFIAFDRNANSFDCCYTKTIFFLHIYFGVCGFACLLSALLKGIFSSFVFVAISLFYLQIIK